MSRFEFYLTDSLEKVFPDKRPDVKKEGFRISVLRGEVPAVQVAYRKTESNTEYNHEFSYEIKGIPAEARVRDVELVPSAFPCYGKVDDNYLSSAPGMFPDLLKPRRDNVIIPLLNQYRALWIDFPDMQGVAAGKYEVEICLKANPVITLGNGRTYQVEESEMQEYRLSFILDVSEEVLPEQKLIHTEWFHGDGLAHYYHTEVFSEAHWQAVENQIRLAGTELGINMLLTPVFTPPLDTEVNGERLTVQLVDIAFENGTYTFDFAKLERWCGLCQKYGIRYLEIPHLFTQWGAYATPKIVVSRNGKEEKLFGWHVPADSPQYRRFLEQFLPALQQKLAELGYEKSQIYFHISDEPDQSQLESYERAKGVAEDLLEGYPVIDALSDYTFYKKGVVKKPVVANNHTKEFAANHVPDLWVYYCCGQHDKVPNRFFAMPSARNRVMGVLMYIYQVEGFLQWGYNFYNSRLSKEPIDPFYDTHADFAFPSGDAFLVYPGKEYQPWSSIRGEVQREGLYDLRALQLLEERVGRKRVLELIHEGYQDTFTFESYPKEKEYFHRLRERINRELEI